MALIGVDLPLPPAQPTAVRRLATAYGLALFLVDLAVMSAGVFLIQVPSTLTPSTTATLTAKLSYVNVSVVTVAIHGSLFYLAASGTKWQTFRRTVDRIDREFRTTAESCRRFRCASIVVLLVPLFCVRFDPVAEEGAPGIDVLFPFQGIMFIMAALLYLDGYGLFSKVVHIAITVLSAVYFNSIASFMWITGWILAFHFRLLARRIGEIDVDGFADEEFDALTHAWKRQYAAVCDGVRRWNAFFDVFLWASVTSAFKENIIFSFFSIDQFFGQRYFSLVLIWGIVVTVSYLWTTCCIAHAIYDHSQAVHRALIDLECRLGRHRSQIQRLAEQAHRSRPTISACGYFQIHRKLFPTVRSPSYDRYATINLVEFPTRN